jgi:hypothetical protein
MNETHEEYKEWYNAELGAFNAKAHDMVAAFYRDRMGQGQKAADKTATTVLSNLFGAYVMAGEIVPPESVTLRHHG